jgi:hypothetical protein
MTKKSRPDDYVENYRKARAVIFATVKACRETLPLVSIMAALGEALSDTAVDLMCADLEDSGTTTDSLEAGRSLLALLDENLERGAVELKRAVKAEVH